MKVQASSLPRVEQKEDYATTVKRALTAVHLINKMRPKLPKQWRAVFSGAYATPGFKPLSMDVMVAIHGDIPDKSAAQLQRFLRLKLGPEFASVNLIVTQPPEDDAIG